MTGGWNLLVGDCIERMRDLPDASVDAIVTDPPYGLSAEPDAAEVLRHWLAGDDYVHRGGGFMGKSWDSFVPGPAVWREAHRVLKPGGHLLAFFGARTYDLGTLAIRLAGFEIRDSLMWMFGSGFPKSRNLDGDWTGWGTALKPGYEPIVLARKPLAGTVAGTVAEYGTGAINIDGCRIPAVDGGATVNATRSADGLSKVHEFGWSTPGSVRYETPDAGRWPANVLLDEDAAAAVDAQSGVVAARESGARVLRKGTSGAGRDGNRSAAIGAESRRAGDACGIDRGDGGGASRFFYCAKASSAERHSGVGRNVHPTVKPLDVMRWLCRLVTPPGGLVLDPFTGSGTTGAAALLEGFRFLGIERDEQYASIARARIEWWSQWDPSTDTAAAIGRGRQDAERAAAGALTLDLATASIGGSK